jgi:hypothetical protein
VLATIRPWTRPTAGLGHAAQLGQRAASNGFCDRSVDEQRRRCLGQLSPSGIHPRLLDGADLSEGVQGLVDRRPQLAGPVKLPAIGARPYRHAAGDQLSPTPKGHPVENHLKAALRSGLRSVSTVDRTVISGLGSSPASDHLGQRIHKNPDLLAHHK